MNATRQKCEISSTQPVYLTIYAGSCSTGSKPHEGEYPVMKSPTDRLNCAQSCIGIIIAEEITKVRMHGKTGSICYQGIFKMQEVNNDNSLIKGNTDYRKHWFTLRRI